jgi:Secretion system C-terminal sorting domain
MRVGTTNATDIEHQGEANIQVWPNPFSNRIYVKNATPGIAFELSDAFGQAIFYGKNVEQADFSKLLPGLYFLKVLSKNPITFKLIKV